MATSARTSDIAIFAHTGAALASPDATADELRAALAEAHERMRTLVGVGVPKAQAARELGISRVSLDRWIKAGRIRTVEVGKRTQVAADDLAALLLEVQVLRDQAEGQRGIVAAALHRLAQQDDTVQAEVGDMLTPGLEAMARGELIPAVIPENFGPDD